MNQYAAKDGIFPVILVVLLLLLFQTDIVSSESSSTSSTGSNDPYGDTNLNLTSSTAVIIVVIVIAIFITVFLSIYIHQCYSDTSPSVRRNPIGRSRRGARGLDAHVIESFPMLQYSEVKDHKIGKGALECAVCLNEFEDHQTLRLIPKCDHVFHPECIDEWLSSHVTCPVCRADLTPQPGEKAESTHPRAESTHPELNPVEESPAGGEVEVVKCDVEAGFERKFPRSHTTGHSLVQPVENIDRFTLRLPEEVRQRIMSRHLDRSMSMVMLPRERSSRRGYRAGEGSSRGKYRPLEKLGEPAARSDQSFSRNPSFLTRASSFLTRASSSIRRPRVAANDDEGASTRSVGSELKEPTRLPV